MRRSRIQIARADIIKFFDESPSHIFSPIEIDSILDQHREFWRLARSMPAREFVQFLHKSGKMWTLLFRFPNRHDTRYVWDTAPILEIIASLRPKCYISHYTAMKAHGLTDQVPRTIYINHEQSGRSDPNSSLTQSAIDSAFRNPQRVSNNIAEMDEYRVCIVAGQNTGNLGVVREGVPDVYTDLIAKVPITDLERTLIDIAVRPVYAGGVTEVLAAYRNAAGQASVNRIAAYLKALKYVYPYHQAIGFYLDRSGGYKESAIDLIRGFPTSFNFYLTYAMGETDYIRDWRLFVPKGF